MNALSSSSLLPSALSISWDKTIKNLSVTLQHTKHHIKLLDIIMCMVSCGFKFFSYRTLCPQLE